MPGVDGRRLLEAACRGIGVASQFQPIVGTARGDVVGYEALLRFPGYEEQNPEVWFAAARATGLADRLEAVALQTAFAARPSLPGNCFLAVNVSPDLLASDSVRQVWREQADLGGVVVELTEQSPIESYTLLEPDLNQLRSAGALIAVDDAGAGYAGLRHLISLRPSIIKIDRELVQDIDKDEAKRALIEMLGLFASKVDAWILAEGVERAEELHTLSSLHVPLVQGYYLARPAAPWAELSPEAQAQLTTQAFIRQRDTTLQALTEPSPTASTIAGAAAIFGQHRDTDWVVLVDRHRRPASLLNAHSALSGVSLEVLKANIHTPVVQALERAITRQPDVRFSPLVVTDDNGTTKGIVRVERLITALTAQHHRV